MIRRFGLALVSIICLGLALAQAQNQTNPTIVGTTGAYNSSPPTCTNGNWCAIQTDVNGKLLTSGSGTVTGTVAIDQTTPGTTNGVVVNSGAVTVTGNVAAQATDSGNPVKVGGKFNSTLPAITDGQRGDMQLEANSDTRVVNGLIAQGGSDAVVNTQVGTMNNKSSHTTAGLYLGMMPHKYNGSTWDRDFTCPSTAVVSVTAAATTELVALVAAKIIRVCSFVITESLAGTAQFVYGTGTNCGTGTTNITGAFSLATSGALSLSSGNGSVFRTATANALCLTAVTGNITGFVTYAQF